MAAGIELIPWESGHDPRLHGWRENVGGPVALDLPPEGAPQGGRSEPGEVPALVVLSWNLWIGRGRLVEVVRLVRAGAFAHLGARPGLPLVVLVQEAYRADTSVPARSNGWGPREPVAGPREDIVQTARRLGLSLRYVPSMRNGAERSDRGNAILSTLPLGEARGIELPLVLQRRVAAYAAVELAGRRVGLVSAHLDPRGPPGHRWLGAAGRALQVQHLLSRLEGETVVLGADLNLARGRAERSWRLLGEAGFAFGVPPAVPGWRHTYHALPRLVLDYLLVRDRACRVAAAAVHRLDEDPRDRGPTVFGSDHHPLLGRIDFHPRLEASDDRVVGV